MINPSELLFTVDDQNNPIEPCPRNEVHEKGYWHRNAHVWLVNDSQEILSHKRSMLKDSNPGKWESFFGGHFGPGVEYRDAAIKELGEELGLQVDDKNLLFYSIYKSESMKEFQGIFVYSWNGVLSDLAIERDEIDEVKMFAWQDLYDKLIVYKDPGWSRMGYEKGILEFIKEKFL